VRWRRYSCCTLLEIIVILELVLIGNFENVRENSKISKAQKLKKMADYFVFIIWLFFFIFFVSIIEYLLENIFSNRGFS